MSMDTLPPTDKQRGVIRYLRLKTNNKEPLEDMVGNRGEAGEWVRRLGAEGRSQKATGRS